jgi:hypothetical protein
MVFIPFVKVKYRTNLSIDSVLEKLDSIIEPKKNTVFGGLSYIKAFSGELFDDNFIIIRNIEYRNSFLPIIKGKIFRENEYTIIEMFLRMHLFVIIFLCIWLSIPFMLICLLLFNSLIKKTSSLGTIIMPVGLFLFGYFLMIGGFNYENTKAQNIIKEVLEAELIDIKYKNNIWNK